MKRSTTCLCTITINALSSQLFPNKLNWARRKRAGFGICRSAFQHIKKDQESQGIKKDPVA